MTTTLVDLVKITCTSAGAGSFHLGSAVTGFFGAEELTDGATYSYSVQQGADKEYGTGAFDLTSMILTRDVIKSSLGTDPVPFTTGAQIAFVLLAEDVGGGGGGGGAVINDGIISSSFVWSSSKTNAQITISAAALAASVSALATSTTNALVTKEPMIAPGLVSQFWRGDKTWAVPDKSSVGLGNVDNTSDANKPVSTAQAAALALKENQALTIAATAATTFTLDATYRNKSLETTAATPVSAIFDPAIPAGAWGYVTQRGAGQISFVATGTGSVRDAEGAFRSRGQWSVVRWYCSANSDGSSAEIVISGETMGYDLRAINMLSSNPNLAISEGISYDGTYLYVTPHNEYIVAKVDPRTMAVIATLDLSAADPSYTGMSDSFVVGGYLYILPHFTSSGPFYQTKVVRVNLANFTAGGVDSLQVITGPSSSYTPRDGFSDGTWGYINIRTTNAMAIIRFGLGANFTAPNVSTLTLTATTGADGAYPIFQANFLICDGTYVFGMALAATVPASDPGGRRSDLWLVRVPLNDFQASSAIFTRVTHQDFQTGSVPLPYQLLDTGTDLWTFPIQFVAGPQTGAWFPSVKIPKANPSAAVVTTPPAGQFPGSATGGTGQAIYDGARYGYAASNTEPKIVQIDTQRPGIVSYVDISTISGGEPMWGMGMVGNYGYAVSFNGARGLLGRLTLTP